MSDAQGTKEEPHPDKQVVEVEENIPTKEEKKGIEDNKSSKSLIVPASSESIPSTTSIKTPTTKDEENITFIEEQEALDLGDDVEKPDQNEELEVVSTPDVTTPDATTPEQKHKKGKEKVQILEQKNEEIASVPTSHKDEEIKSEEKSEERKDSQRDSIESEKSVVLDLYRTESRMPDDRKQSHKISGDFQPFVHTMDPFVLLTEIQEEEVEDEYTKTPKYIFYKGSTEGIIVSYTRKTFCKKLLKLKAEKAQLSIRNSLLNKYVYNYYKKKNLTHTLEPDEFEDEKLKIYHSELDKMDKQNMILSHERDVLETQIDFIKRKKRKKEMDIQLSFEELQHREYQLAQGLIFEKSGRRTGNTLSERQIMIYINRQLRVYNELTQLKNSFHYTKVLTQEREKEIDDINEVAPGLYLNYYEMLKNEYQIYCDRIEEKDNELNYLRAKSTSFMQILAHVREKCNALDCDLDSIKEEILDKENEMNKKRHLLNEVKQERDLYRSQLHQLKIESGLLAETTLLKDMEESLKERVVRRKELKEIQEQYQTQLKQLRNLRRTREMLEIAKKRGKVQQCVKKATSKVPHKISKPDQLYQVTIPIQEFDHLKKFKLDVKSLTKE